MYQAVLPWRTGGAGLGTECRLADSHVLVYLVSSVACDERGQGTEVETLSVWALADESAQGERQMMIEVKVGSVSLAFAIEVAETASISEIERMIKTQATEMILKAMESGHPYVHLSAQVADIEAGSEDHEWRRRALEAEARIANALA